MVYNGSGTFDRVHNWQEDADNLIDINADRHDAEDDGFATGLSNAITKDGQTTITANLPMSTYRHTGVGNASSRTDYAAAGQVQDGALTYIASTGSANAYVLTLSPAITAYAAGQSFSFKANHASTGAATLNVSGLGAKAIKKLGDSTALASNDIVIDQIVKVTYDGTQFQMHFNPENTAAASVTLGTATASSTTTFTNKTIDADATGNVITNIGSSEVKSELITGQTDGTIAAGDSILFSDADDSGNLKDDTVQGILDLVTPGGLVLLATATASASAYIQFTSGIDSTYEEYEVHIINAQPASDGVNMFMQTSTDGGSSYDSGASDYGYAGIGLYTGTAANVTDGASDIIRLTCRTVGSGTGEGVSGVIKFFNPAAAVPTYCTWLIGFAGTGTNEVATTTGAGNRNASADVDAFQIYFDGVNTTSGEFKLYGVKKS